MAEGRAAAQEAALATLAPGLGCMPCLRHYNLNAEVDGAEPLKIPCLLPLGKKKKCCRCRVLKDNCDPVSFM